MKKNELEKLLQDLSPKLYELAYVIIPDDLQASQVVIDSTQRFVIDEEEWIECLDTNGLNKVEESQVKKDVYRIVLKTIYQTGIRRYSQLAPKTFEEDNNNQNHQGFYTLDASLRACLYLKYKTDFNIEEMMEITGLKKHDLLAKLYSGQGAMEAFHQVNS
jgi:hypothetical protein